MAELEALCLFIKHEIERNAYTDIVVDQDAIKVTVADKKHLWFKNEHIIKAELVDLQDKIEKLWMAIYWDIEQQRGIMLLVSSSAFYEQEVGIPFAVEAWWPYPLPHGQH
jgi:hypothetical protein